MGEAEGRQEKDEAGRPGGSAPGGLPGPAESDGLAVPSAPIVTGATQGAGAVSARSKPLWREYAEAIVIAVVLALFIRTFIVQAFKIPSGSMVPTLTIGDHILVTKFLYNLKTPFGDTILVRFSEPQRGDIIVFKYPEDESKDFIKRVVGVPGDTIEVRSKRVWINGELLPEPYVQHTDPNVLPHQVQPRDNLGPLTVPPDSYFVMGDNRDQSLDSRFWGFVRLPKIKGKAFLIYWSWNGQGPLSHWVRWERIGKTIR
ncbi:MAG TPA: signal peptidase I [Nitrospirales bacterium]|jgi:signal peptidase I|nr:signal peptidase I [Nitrospirales bacterium]